MPTPLPPFERRRSLVFTAAAPALMPTPLVGADEVLIGPNQPTRIDGNGRYHSIATSAPGTVDMAGVLALLPPTQRRPDVVLVQVGAGMGARVANLHHAPGRKVLLAGDTHHLRAPIRTLVDYALTEPFDLVAGVPTRQHLHWFRRAGCSRVHWLPAFHNQLRPRPARASPRPVAAFAGTLQSPHHPARQRVLGAIRDAGLPFRAEQTDPDGLADMAADAAVSPNASLNGDLNRRVFEVLGAGGLLLTDRLGPHAGLDRLFTEGVHYLAYSTPAEAVEQTRRVLADPAAFGGMRRAGQGRVLAQHDHAANLRRLETLLAGGPEDPLLALDDDPRWTAAATPDPHWRERAARYEALQELHRCLPGLALVGPGVDRDDPLVLAASDLPRLALAPIQEPPAAQQVLLLTAAADPETALADHAGEWVLAADATAAGRAHEALGRFGFARHDEDATLYRLADTGTNLGATAEAGGALARAAKTAAWKRHG